jgi:hypothetical protein
MTDATFSASHAIEAPRDLLDSRLLLQSLILRMSLPGSQFPL